MYEKFKIADAIFFKGKEYFLKGNYKKAEKELKKCIETMPEHVEAHFYLSHVLYKKEDFQKALEHIEKAKANFELMADLFTYAHHQYILQLREQVDTIDSQISDLQDKLFGTTDADTKRNFEAQISSLEQKKGTIRSRLTEPVSPSESIPADYFYFHGNILFRLNKHQEAFREYLEAIKKIPSMGMLTIILLICILWAKQYQKALDSLNRAEANGVKTNPKLKKAILKAIKK